MQTTHRLVAAVFAAALLTVPASVRAVDDTATAKPAAEKTAEKTPEKAPPAEITTPGEVIAGGQHIAYNAIAGTITVGATDAQDAQLGLDGKPQPGSQLALSAPKEPKDAAAHGADVLRGLLQEGRQGGRAADYLLLQRRSGQLDGVAAHGLAGAQTRGDGTATRTCPPRLTGWWTMPIRCST